MSSSCRLLEAPGPASRPVRAVVRGPVVEKSGRFVFLDALRGIAALWVVAYHLTLGGHVPTLLARMPAWSVTFLRAGHLGVPMFFVLSGFVIAHSMSRSRVDLPFIGRFALRRCTRLDPPYWASIALVLILGLVSNLANRSPDYHPPAVSTVVANLFYLQGILGVEDINGVCWTLTFEVQFYLVFCLLMGLVHATRRDEADKRSLYLVFVPALLVGALWPLGIVGARTWPALFPCLWHGFLLGMLACWAMNGTVHPGLFLGYAATLGAGAAWNGYGWAGACVVTSVSIYGVARIGGLTRWLNWPWLQVLGLISYSLYLTHQPIMGAFFNVGYRVFGRSLATEALGFVAMFAVAIACGWASWWMVERPSLAMAHHLNLRWKPAPGGPEFGRALPQSL